MIFLKKLTKKFPRQNSAFINFPFLRKELTQNKKRVFTTRENSFLIFDKCFKPIYLIFFLYI